MKVTVLGAGIAAYYFVEGLAELEIPIELTWIYDEKVNPSNNSKIIPIVSLNGITKNNSALGDLLYDSYFLLKENIVPKFQHCFKRQISFFLSG